MGGEQIIDIIEHPQVILWMRETLRRNPEHILRLTGPNQKYFQQIFGKPQIEKADTKEWLYQDRGLNIILHTNATSTIFKIKLNTTKQDFLLDRRMGVGIAGILQDLVQKINDNSF